MSWHYFEAHVTVEPVFEERLQLFKTICAGHGFRVATLLMQRRKNDAPERSANDSFCTGRSKNYKDLFDRMISLLCELKEQNFTVWRYKIEDTVLDSRYDDGTFPLDRATLPEKEKNPREPV